MKKIRLWLLIVIVIIPLHNLYSQKKDYIATDSSLNSGIKLIEGTARDNAQYIRLKSKNQEKKYFPKDLTKYRLKGTVYISKNISILGQTKKVFLKRLEHGKITLYYYTEEGISTYFLEKDSSVFVEISKGNNFQKKLSDNTSDFNWNSEQIRLVRYNKNSLSKLISMYNNGKNRPLPYPRFGIITGYRSTSLTIPVSMRVEQLNDISFTPNSTASYGVFADLPIGMSYFSFNTGIMFSKSRFSANSRNSQSDTDVLVNLSSLNIPILIRYTLPTLVWRPFFNTGGIYSYQLKNESKIYESYIDQNVITINEVDQESLISANMLGYSIGVGLQRNISYRKIASVEIRFNQFPGSENTLQKRQFDILISFSF